MNDTEKKKIISEAVQVIPKQEIQEPLHFRLAEFFLKAGPEKVISHKEVGDMIYVIKREMKRKKNEETTYSELYSLIGGARKVLERDFKKTIFCIPKSGYKLATEFEQTYFAAKTYKRLMQLSIRTKRLIPLIVKKHVPEVLLKAFKPAEQARLYLEEAALTFNPAFKELDNEVKRYKNI